MRVQLGLWAADVGQGSKGGVAGSGGMCYL